MYDEVIMLLNCFELRKSVMVGRNYDYRDMSKLIFLAKGAWLSSYRMEYLVSYYHMCHTPKFSLPFCFFTQHMS